MPRKPRRRLLPNGLLLALLVGMVLVPALLSLSVGIVALALWRQAFDIVFGVLVLSFAASAIAGGTAAVFFVRRSARLAELQADFVANVSHELRTPLAGIRLVAETLEAGRGDDPGRLAVLTEMLGDEVRRLEDLVERVLAWRSADRQAQTPGRDRLEIGELIREAVADIARLPEGRSASIGVDAPNDLPPVLGDRGLLLQAFRNLLHNAVKFGGADGPVRVAADHHGDEIVITVADEGPGIPPSEQERVFQRFYRGSGQRRNAGGTGLGLDIVKIAVEAHGGAVALDNDVGRGASFAVRLPVAPEERDG